jgi:hypothetical protein
MAHTAVSPAAGDVADRPHTEQGTDGPVAQSAQTGRRVLHGRSPLVIPHMVQRITGVT